MRVGTVCYATDQGLGMLAKWFYEAGVVTDVMLMRHRSFANHPEWYPPGTPMFRTARFSGPEAEAFAERIDAALFFETPFDWKFPDYLRAKGVKTLLMPMYEWSLKNPPHKFDKYLCPSKLDQQYFPGSPFLPVPVDPSTWRRRTVVRRFLHNAGHIGHRSHKGTEELIAAIPYLDEDVQLTIRGQNGHLFRLVEKYGHEHPGVSFEVGEVSYDKLFDGYDAYVAPEKFNGLSLPLQEARAAGLLVITTDRFPANDWIPREPLIPVSSYRRANISGSYNDFDEAVVSPQDIARVINEWNGTGIDLYNERAFEWARWNTWDVLKPMYLKEIETA